MRYLRTKRWVVYTSLSFIVLTAGDYINANYIEYLNLYWAIVAATVITGFLYLYES